MISSQNDRRINSTVAAALNADNFTACDAAAAWPQVDPVDARHFLFCSKQSGLAVGLDPLVFSSKKYYSEFFNEWLVVQLVTVQGILTQQHGSVCHRSMCLKAR